ncbi:MAG: hypothetical protein H8E48_14450 [Chloroflexi bacterium]|nr:hypothetical protein [Chloroflexota bacterium]
MKFGAALIERAEAFHVSIGCFYQDFQHQFTFEAEFNRSSEYSSNLQESVQLPAVL